VQLLAWIQGRDGQGLKLQHHGEWPGIQGFTLFWSKLLLRPHWVACLTLFMPQPLSLMWTTPNRGSKFFKISTLALVAHATPPRIELKNGTPAPSIYIAVI
jgi:hypothetical protein